MLSTRKGRTSAMTVSGKHNKGGRHPNKNRGGQGSDDSDAIGQGTISPSPKSVNNPATPGVHQAAALPRQSAAAAAFTLHSGSILAVGVALLLLLLGWCYFRRKGKEVYERVGGPEEVPISQEDQASIELREAEEGTAADTAVLPLTPSVGSGRCGIQAPDIEPTPAAEPTAAVPTALPLVTRLELHRGEGVEGEEHCWSALRPDLFDVRGPSYLQDGKKMPAADVSEVRAVDPPNLISHPTSLSPRWPRSVCYPTSHRLTSLALAFAPP